MGYIIEVEGIKLEVENEPPKEGEMYVAQRNTGPHLLTAKKVDMKNRWVVPVEKAYVFDLHECKRVIRMIDE